MKIVGFSINPLFEDRVIGGSAKHQRNVLVHLGELGHQVTVLCTSHPESHRPFQWHPNVTVLPILPFRQPFPQPYAITPYQLATIVQIVAEHLVEADRFYMHDGELLLPYLYRDVPTVISLRDSIYPETILGSFLFAADRLITITEHARQICLHTAGRFLPDLADRALTINNGIDFALFAPGAPSSAIQSSIPVDPTHHFVVLHPHRPEPTKGLDRTIAVADQLVHRYGCTELRVLVPRWYDEAISPEVRAFYSAAEQEIAARGLREQFIFHDWVPQRSMPDYYRLGHLTLVLGSFVEAFGNVAYESLACGTPAIVSRVATHRSLLPDHLIDKVHFGDDDTAASIANAIWRSARRTSTATMNYLRQHFAIEDQLEAYARTILGAQRVAPPTPCVVPLGPTTRYHLAPWCYQWGEGMVFHDYRAHHEPMPELSKLLAAYPDGFDPGQAHAAGISATTISAWLQDGYIAPKVG